MDPHAGQLTLQVPLAVPPPARLEEIFREECAKVVAARATWFDFKGAAEYLKISLRTFERRKSDWALPVAQLSSGIKIVYRDDLDTLAFNHVEEKAHPVCPECSKPVLIEFPSIVERDQRAVGSSFAAVAAGGRK